jgi:hypothetical protein
MTHTHTYIQIYIHTLILGKKATAGFSTQF